VAPGDTVGLSSISGPCEPIVRETVEDVRERRKYENFESAEVKEVNVHE
jgi:hypothetical protein